MNTSATCAGFILGDPLSWPRERKPAVQRSYTLSIKLIHRSKQKVKDYSRRVVDESPDAAKGITITDIVKGNLQKLPQPERFIGLNSLIKKIPKVEGIQQYVCAYKRRKHRAAVEPSSSVNRGRRCTSAFKHRDTLISFETFIVTIMILTSPLLMRILQVVDPAIPSRQFTATPWMIHLPPSHTVDDTDIISIDDYQLKTTLVDSQSFSQLPRRQLQDPAA
ncbi:hypothetical protein FDENT_11405 [Fusarium denticulatum]|uniref:Uncharacterized protein n=1 Tax=Fusarium denticulatum TaxID=48507 RepID=A0A8H5TK12_9HYPO|nr:hypothetical protein FDENT_11405 [Fusarium denticulatum]